MTVKRTLWFLTAGALSLMLTACPGPAPTKGVLEITVNAPTGVTPDVQVTGPGTSSTINTTGATTLSDKEPGDYTVAVNKVVIGGIGYTGSGATLKVEAGKKTSYTVSYAASSGKIRVTLAGLPDGLDAEVNLKKGDGSNLNSAPINADTTLEDVAPGTYTIEAPNRTQGSSTYASAQNGATVTVVEGEEAVVNVAYTLNPGSATIDVAGLDPAALPTGPVTVTLTQGSTSINRTFQANGPVNFANLAPGDYTITANAITGNGTQDYAFALSKTTLNIASGSTDTATLTYSKPTVTVNLTGLPAAPSTANSVIALTGGPASVPNTTITGTARSATITVPRFGSYTVNATSIVAGTTVDSFYFSASAVSATPSAATPTPTVSRALTARGQTGNLFVAGKGVLGGAGVNASYRLADGTSTLAAFLPSSGTIVDGLFKVAFDAEGNAYLIYQVGGSNPARIVRISEANLRAGQLSDTAPGNKVIQGSAFYITSSEGGNEEVEPTDVAFDAQGNLWIANDNGSAIACVSRTQLTGSGPTITTGDQRIGGTGTPAGVYRFVRGLAFDRNGNLWFTSDDFVASDPARRSRLSRLPASVLTCSGGLTPLTPDIQLNISNAAGPGNPIIKPSGLALSPDGNSLWVADYGGSFQKRVYTETRTYSGTGSSQTFTTTVTAGPPTNIDADLTEESVVRIRIDNVSPNPSLQTATIADRINIGTGSGLQQPFGLAFDKNGRLWVATNNNVTVTAGDVGSTSVTLTPTVGSPVTITTGGTCTPPNTSFPPGPYTDGQVISRNFTSCLAAGALTDRRGKLYALDVSGTPSSTPGIPRSVSPTLTFSASLDGVGFTGVAFNIAPSNAPMYVRPTQ